MITMISSLSSGKTSVLSGSIHSGDFLKIMGASGAGKTSLLSIITFKMQYMKDFEMLGSVSILLHRSPSIVKQLPQENFQRLLPTSARKTYSLDHWL
jgi:ABC-type multidrug transport system ATPase subunit